MALVLRQMRQALVPRSRFSPGAFSLARGEAAVGGKGIVAIDVFHVRLKAKTAEKSA
jgi:hypothetical protein